MTLRAIESHPELFAGLVAVLLSLPALWFPYLSDDWAVLESVRHGVSASTAWLDFRPLFMASFYFEQKLWGLSPAGSHAVNVALIALTAGLVVKLARRYGVDDRTAALTGLLFATHPWHVECAAWSGARTELYTVPFLLAALAYDRWRFRMRFAPLAAMLLYEAALLTKETAGTLPAFIILVGVLSPARRANLREWIQGYLPLIVQTLAHFLILRTWILGGAGRTLLSSFGARWIVDAAGYFVAAIVPAGLATLGSRKTISAAIAFIGVSVLFTSAWSASRRLPRLAIGAAAGFLILLGPGVVGFQDRYIFLASAASALFLASLLGLAHPRVARGFIGCLVMIWGGYLLIEWWSWNQAATASRSLIDGLVEASHRPGIDEIEVVNMPLMVAGGSVAGDFRAALGLSGGIAMPVRAALYVSYPSADYDVIESTAATGSGFDIRLNIPKLPSLYGVGLPAPGELLRTLSGEVSVGENPALITIHVPSRTGLALYEWKKGRLEQLEPVR